VKNQIFTDKEAQFFDYLLSYAKKGNEKLPPIATIGEDLGISTPNIRELIATAKVLGLISIQPRTGISILPYKFSPAILKSLYFAVKSDSEYFDQYSDLRNELEKTYFFRAAAALSEEDISLLFQIVTKASEKLNGDPIQIPHEEHKAFHMAIYKNLNNTFVDGLLNAYWDMYELIGLNTYNGINYLQRVWKYHKEIAQAIQSKDLAGAYQLLHDHIELLSQREMDLRSLTDAK